MSKFWGQFINMVDTIVHAWATQLKAVQTGRLRAASAVVSISRGLLGRIVDMHQLPDRFALGFGRKCRLVHFVGGIRPRASLWRWIEPAFFVEANPAVPLVQHSAGTSGV
ncbi:hypothetical protein [Piscinibacter koreensis]|uniref:Uncharacterized protein n=1 Tax=Piscinibacter koreensis TaxID=2742824 RepID=A0A7Y6TYU9_9BURK|nr:hypothetical protein [Schlegelella koreensis]NUZ08451.1 hypothetical protein [Schlegelella koreensis]